jgi:hypothetical protein
MGVAAHGPKKATDRRLPADAEEKLPATTAEHTKSGGKESQGRDIHAA